MALSTLIRGSEQTSDFEGASYKKRSDFKLGATLVASDEILLWPSDQGGDGFYYQWLGGFPKNVPAGSTPASSGGIGSTTWAIVPAAPRVIVAATLADLRKVDPRKSTTVQTLGYYAIGDQGQGLYRFDSADTTSADNGGTIIVGLANSRWKLVYDEQISIRQFGARGDGTTNDTAAIQRAHDNIPRGVTVFYPLGQFYVTSTILANGGSNVRCASRSTTVDSAQCVLIGATTLDGVFKVQTGGNVSSVKVENLVVTRRGSGYANTVRGIIVSGTDQTVLVDCAAYNHGIPLHVNGQLNPIMVRFNSWRCSLSHVKISNVVEPRFINCRFGRNGGQDTICESYVWIDGSEAISPDTIDFLGCQFNQSGAEVNRAIRISNYANVNGIINFVDCHTETWTTFFLGLDATATRVQRISMTNCTVSSAGGPQLIGGVMAGVVEDLKIIGCTLVGRLTFDQVTSATLSASYLGGELTINSGNVVATSNRITGKVTLLGNAGKITCALNQIGGGLDNTHTGSQYVQGNI